MIARHIRPITTVLQALDRGERPTSAAASRAIVRALNLPFFSFLRVTLFHGPAAALCAGLGLYVANRVADGGFATWQIVGLTLSIFLFASPAHAISEFFVIAKRIIPQVERLWAYCERVELEDQKRIIAIRLRSKLLYLSIFLNSLPLLFFAGTIVFKVDRLLLSLGVDARLEQMWPILSWAVGVVLVCMVGTLAMSVFTASEVSRSAARLAQAMRGVEHGDLDNDLKLSSTDEYAELFRGFNLMLASLREEVRILQLSHDLAGELNLDLLLSRLMHATTELLGADRSTLFLYDRKTNELFSRVAEGLEIREIRIPHRHRDRGRRLPVPSDREHRRSLPRPPLQQGGRPGHRVSHREHPGHADRQQGGRLHRRHPGPQQAGRAVHGPGRGAAGRLHGPDHHRARERQALRGRSQRAQLQRGHPSLHHRRHRHPGRRGPYPHRQRGGACAS